MIASQQALAVRRLLLIALALTATLAAHADCAGGLSLTPAAPVVWGTACCLAVLAPRRGRRWSEWSAPGLLWRLAVLEGGLHLALTAAPWAFGVRVHHAPPPVGPRMLIAHACAALILALVFYGAQRLLSLAQGIVRAVRRVLRAAHRPGAPCGAPAPWRTPRPAVARVRSRAPRGPPVPAV